MDTLAPTPEQLGRWHVDAPSVDQKVNRSYFRRVTLIERMERMGVLRDEQAAAWRRWHFDYEQASRVPSGVGGYGQRIGGAYSELDPLDLKNVYHHRTLSALDAIGAKHREVLLSLAVDEWMTLKELGAVLNCGRIRASSGVREALYALHLHYSGPPQRR